MAGISEVYVLGGEGGFLGSDGVNPVDAMLLVGHGERMWYEAVYVDPSLRPLGKVKVVVPRGSHDADGLLDAVIAFFPHYFANCPSLTAVELQLGERERLDLTDQSDDWSQWYQLREEARTAFERVNIWFGSLRPIVGPDRPLLAR